MSTVVSPETTAFPTCNNASWSEEEMAGTASAPSSPEIQLCKVEKKPNTEEEDVMRFSVSIDKSAESGTESEPLTPDESLTGETQMNVTFAATATTVGGVELVLDNEDLWQKFCSADTEMIITKAGRRMFPAFTVSVSGLQADQKYIMTFTCTPANDKRYKYVSNKWVVAGKGESHVEDLLKYVHPESPASGKHWMNNKLSFKKVKLTNNKTNKKGNISLNSMQKYIPTVTISKSVSKKHAEIVHVQEFPQAAFYAVTAYQNDLVTQLKIDYNPFAKAFRESTSEQEITQSYPGQNGWLAGSTGSLSPHCHSPLYIPTCPPASPLLSPHWPPPSPLLSAYHDFTQAAYMSTTSAGSIPIAGPSPLPQFGTVFGSLDTASYAMSNPIIRSALGHLSHCTSSS